MKLLRKEEWKNSGVYVFDKTYAMLNAISKLTTECTVNSTTLLALTTVESLRLVILLIPSNSILVRISINRLKQCQGLKDVLKEVTLANEGSSWKPYSSEQREDVLYDFDRAHSDILLWKAHIVRSINQGKAKQDALKSEDPHSAILIMDWAMKFLQIKFREKQSEWFGKRGLSWPFFHPYN